MGKPVQLRWYARHAFWGVNVDDVLAKRCSAAADFVCEVVLSREPRTMGLVHSAGPWSDWPALWYGVP